MPFMERRRAQRFDFQLPVILRWKQGSENREVRTLSENVSSNGIYLSLAEEIKNDTRVEVDLTLPHRVTMTGPLSVRCYGRVQRCERVKGNNHCMAAVFDKLEFLTPIELAEKKHLSFC